MMTRVKVRPVEWWYDVLTSSRKWTWGKKSRELTMFGVPKYLNCDGSWAPDTALMQCHHFWMGPLGQSPEGLLAWVIIHGFKGQGQSRNRVYIKLTVRHNSLYSASYLAFK